MENVTEERRRLNVQNDFKSVQVDWTNDAVFYPAYINRDLTPAAFARQMAPIEYQIGRKALFGARCVPGLSPPPCQTQRPAPGKLRTGTLATSVR